MNDTTITTKSCQIGDGFEIVMTWRYDECPDTSFYGEFTSNRPDRYYFDTQKDLLLGEIQERTIVIPKAEVLWNGLEFMAWVDEKIQELGEGLSEDCEWGGYDDFVDELDNGDLEITVTGREILKEHVGFSRYPGQHRMYEYFEPENDYSLSKEEQIERVMSNVKRIISWLMDEFTFAILHTQVFNNEQLWVETYMGGFEYDGNNTAEEAEAVYEILWHLVSELQMRDQQDRYARFIEGTNFGRENAKRLVAEME